MRSLSTFLKPATIRQVIKKHQNLPQGRILCLHRKKADHLIFISEGETLGLSSFERLVVARGLGGKLKRN
jgi:hypothetical protein